MKQNNPPWRLTLVNSPRRWRSSREGVFQYLDWLPTDKYLDIPELGKPFTYKSEGLAKRLGLSNLYIAFSGYWPEKGANLITRTFKELEAQVVMANTNKPLIVPSAGNAANGFNLIAHLMGVKVYLVVPESGLDKLLLPFKTTPFVVAVKGDYADAIEVAKEVGRRTGIKSDIGATSALRQAGGGAVMLNAIMHPNQGSGALYHHYFQAVGSGTGAIGAWAAVRTLYADRQFGSARTRIHISQNAPYCPLVDSWEAIRSPMSAVEAREKVAAITADVLANRNPPHTIVCQVLRESNGTAWRVSNYAVFHAARAFREAEGVDIGPPAAVAVDALKQAVEAGVVQKDERVLLHITGGGKEIQYSDGEVYQVEPSITVRPDEIEKAVEAING